MSSQDFAIAIMAAGKGTRLTSKHPKVLHAIAGKPLLQHVIEAAQQVVPVHRIYAIIGHEAERVQQAVAATGVAVAGTGVAVGGTGVAVGGTAVAVGGTAVAVGGTAVAVGGTGVAAALPPIG